MTYIQQLENTINSYDHSKDLSAVVAGENMNLKIENQRYKEALEFYADRENHEPTLIHEAEYENGILVSPPDVEPPVIYFDKGERARKELRGEST